MISQSPKLQASNNSKGDFHHLIKKFIKSQSLLRKKDE